MNQQNNHKIIVYEIFIIQASCKIKIANKHLTTSILIIIIARYLCHCVARNIYS